MNKYCLMLLALGISLMVSAIEPDLPSADRAGNGGKQRPVLPLDGDRAGNGGGTGEKNVLFAYLSLPKYVRACLQSPACAADSKERDLLGKILNDMKAHPVNPKRILIVSETQSPGVFHSDGLAHGVPRSARTGDESEGYIWINRDHLYRQSAKGTTEPIDEPTAAALLLDEVAHHVEPAFKDVTEHTRLDLLCARLRVLLSSQSQSVTSDSTSLPLTVSVLNLDGASSQVRVSNVAESRDLSDKIRTQVNCPGGRRKVRSFALTNLHWHKSVPRSRVQRYGELAMDAIENPRQQTLHAWLDLECDGQPPRKAGALQIYLQFMYSDFPNQAQSANVPPRYRWSEPVSVQVFPCEPDDISSPACH